MWVSTEQAGVVILVLLDDKLNTHIAHYPQKINMYSLQYAIIIKISNSFSYGIAEFILANKISSQRQALLRIAPQHSYVWVATEQAAMASIAMCTFWMSILSHYGRLDIVGRRAKESYFMYYQP